MHRSRINGILIDCNVNDIQEAAQFWAGALGRPVDPDHPGTRGNYVMLEGRPDEISVQIQRVDHESRVHLDIETDDTLLRSSVSKSSGRPSTRGWSAGSSCRLQAASAFVWCASSATVSIKTP